MSEAEPAAVHVLIGGRVQGVGFRMSCQREATSLGLAGWVRNLPDGRVEAQFEGPEQVVRRMLAWCEEGPRAAYVESVTPDWSAAPTSAKSFEIR